MEAKDLMIGNWVYFGECHSNMGGDYDVIFFEKQLTLEDFKFFADNDWNKYDFDEFLKPIPITPEILEKNGFKSCEFYGELTIDNWRIMCDCLNIAILNENHVFLDIPIKWVHELQHALKLCQIEKEIVL